MSGARKPFFENLREIASIVNEAIKSVPSAFADAAKPRYARGGVVPSRHLTVVDGPDRVVSRGDWTKRRLPPPINGLEYQHLRYVGRFVWLDQEPTDRYTVRINEDGTFIIQREGE